MPTWRIVNLNITKKPNDFNEEYTLRVSSL